MSIIRKKAMLNEHQCNQALQKLNNAACSADAFGNPCLALLEQMKQCVQNGDEDGKLRICKAAQGFTDAACGSRLDEAVCAFLLAELSSDMPEMPCLNEQAQMTADGFIRCKEGMSGDENAAAAALLMALQNNHLPPFMRPAYIGHACIFSDRAIEIGACGNGLSPTGKWLLKQALERLIDARRKYRW